MNNSFLENEERIARRIQTLKEMIKEIDSHVEGSLTPQLTKMYPNSRFDSEYLQNMKEFFHLELEQHESRNGNLKLSESFEMLGYVNHRPGNILIAHPFGATCEEKTLEDLDIESLNTLMIVPYKSDSLISIENEYLTVHTYAEVKDESEERFFNQFDKIVCYEIKYIFERKRFEEYKCLQNILLKERHEGKSIYYLTSTYDKDFTFKVFQSLSYVAIYDYRSIVVMERFIPKSYLLFNKIEELTSSIKDKIGHLKENLLLVVALCDTKDNQMEILQMGNKMGLNPILIPKCNLTKEQLQDKIDFFEGDLNTRCNLVILESIEDIYDFNNNYIDSIIVDISDESEANLFISRFNSKINLYQRRLRNRIEI